MTATNPIGDELRRLRNAAGLTLHEFAARTGIPWQTLAGYEAGNTVPPADKLLRIAHAMRRVRPAFQFERIARALARQAGPTREPAVAA